jgi:ribosomal protein S18 acetylase RimI-like enzyme
MVAGIGGKVVGTISIAEGSYSSTAAITGMWVDPNVRRLGIGRTLVSAAENFARSNGYNQIFLWVMAGNEPAEKLYEAAGFSRTGHSTIEGDHVEFEMKLTISP